MRALILTMIVALTAAEWGYMIYTAWAMENVQLVETWMPPTAGGA